MKKWIVAGILCIALATGCQHLPDYTDFIKQSTSVSSNCDADTVYFENEIMPLLNSNCGMAGCHDAGSHSEGVNVSSYAALLNSNIIVPGKPGSSKIMHVINSSDPDDKMPPNGTLSDDQKAKLEKWISQGARDNKCTSGCDSTQFKFAANVQPIIDINCKGCHTGTYPSAGIRLDNYSDIKIHADNGNLMGVIEWEAGYKRMPSGTTKLPPCEIATIKKWIQAGSLNN